MGVRRLRRTPVPKVELSATVRTFLGTGEWPPRGARDTEGGVWELLGLTVGVGEPKLRELWAVVGDELVREWVQAHPGSRPWAWWRFSAPRWARSDWPPALHGCGPWAEAAWAEPRRVLGGSGAADWAQVRFGVPRVRAGSLVVESESEYLRRHRLMRAGEWKRLKAADYEPVVVHAEPDEAVQAPVERAGDEDGQTLDHASDRGGNGRPGGSTEEV